MAGRDDELQKWNDYSASLGFTTPLQAEKDYLQELLLMDIFSVVPPKLLVFRGGTALSKLYATGRFSEDLDFALAGSAEKDLVKESVAKAIGRMSDYYTTRFSLEEYRNMLKYTLRVDGPVYNATRNSQARQTVRIDINLYAFPLMAPELKRRVPIYDDIRPYYLYSERSEELVADKISAILERKKTVARDVYDLWAMLSKYKTKVDIAFLNRKLSKYGEKGNERFIRTKFLSRLASASAIWNRELSRLTIVDIKYKEARKVIMDSIGRR